MEEVIKFIHCADIHLGSTLSINGEVDEGILKMSEKAIFMTFHRIVDMAIKEKVDFLLIGGDLYDKDGMNLRAQKFFNEECARLKKEYINVYIICGNHDPIGSIEEIFNLPDNVKKFKDDKVITLDYVKDRKVMARIAGVSYVNKKLSGKVVNEFKGINDGILDIGMLHTSLEPNSAYAPCSVEMLENSSINYWALGHIHKNKEIKKEKSTIVYSGIPQGRDMGEKGDGGCYLVEYEGEKLKDLSYISLNCIIYKEIEIKLHNAIDNLDKLIKALILEKEKEFKDIRFHDNKIGIVIRWVITGRTCLHKTLIEIEEGELDLLLKEINSELFFQEKFVWSDSIKINTSPIIEDLEEILQQNEMCRELNRIYCACKYENEFEKEIKEQLGDIWYHCMDSEDENLEKFCIHDEIYEEILYKAYELILQELIDNR